MESDLSAALRAEPVYDQFEAAWRQGARPDLRAALGDLPEPVRPVGLYELLKLDVFYRRRAGERPSAGEYCDAFPQYARVVDAFFGQDETVLEQVVPDRPGIAAELPGFEDFQDIKYLGNGGMGVVYRAFDRQFNMEVALKFPLPDLLLSPEHFARDYRSIARLHHRNIVQVHRVGFHPGDGRPYFTMTLVEGGSVSRYAAGRDPHLAAKLLIKVARAVHHAHQRGILHRDLKPGNVLVDRYEEPVVTDFGLATLAPAPGAAPPELPERGSTPSGSLQGVVGTIKFMSPEQAAPSEVTQVSDVYGLGAVLYALLTGRPPFEGTDFEAVRKDVLDPACLPPRPRELNPRVDQSLEAICSKCLAKSPHSRYPSAEGFARDLERWLAHEEVEARPLPLLHPERVGRWCRRNLGLAAATGAAIVLLVLSAVLANLGAYHEAKAVEAAGESNTRAAEMVADNVLWLLRDLSRDVVESAESEPVRQLLGHTRGARGREDLDAFYQQQEGRRLKAAVGQMFQRCNRRLAERDIPPFATFYFLNERGVLVAFEATSKGKSNLGDLFHGRDYFIVPKRYAAAGRDGTNAVHVSRVFRSQFDGFSKFSVAAPVLGDGGTFLGVVSATIAVHRTMGLSGQSLHHSDQQAVLVGRTDQSPAREGDAQELPARDHQILLHDAFEDSAELGRNKFFVVPTSPWPETTSTLPELVPRPGAPLKSDDRYRDPLAEQDAKYAGRWLAGFAPVGNTELVVIVQQRYDEAIGRPVALAKTFVWSAWGALALAFGVAAAIIASRSLLRRAA